ncbi:MAG: hypothetical protein L0Y72_11055 [Gemmataceae bacterium]|nr:hypothetical protein [Gemmataceae bacterium]MCI0739574.1 hypothetical protein [Gemmataceae bacterium]
MRSNITVGLPIDLLVYADGDLEIKRWRRFAATDPQLVAIRTLWEQSLR